MWNTARAVSEAQPHGVIAIGKILPRMKNQERTHEGSSEKIQPSNWVLRRCWDVHRRTCRRRTLPAFRSLPEGTQQESRAGDEPGSCLSQDKTGCTHETGSLALNYWDNKEPLKVVEPDAFGNWMQSEWRRDPGRGRQGRLPLGSVTSMDADFDLRTALMEWQAGQTPNQ